MPYVGAWPIPARPIATGMSRRGSFISSAAVEAARPPTNGPADGDDGDEHRRRGAGSPADPVHRAACRRGRRSSVKNASNTISPPRPLVRTHLPSRSGMIAATVAAR